MKLFELFATLGLDASRFDAGVNNAQKTISKAKTAITKAGKAISAVGKTTYKVSASIIEQTEKSLKSVVKSATASTAAVGAAAVAIGKKMLDARSSVEQGIGGAESTFKDSANEIIQNAGAAWEKAGLSVDAYLGYANKIGAVLQGSGFGVQESARMAATMIQRAADVASVMGISVDDAVTAVTGMAKSNFTMMDNLGAAITDEIIQQQAVKEGIKETTSAMSLQQKIGLAYNRFLDESAKYAGNYAKENETAAGALSTATASLSNYLAGVQGSSVEQAVSSMSNYLSIAAKTLGADSFKPLIDGATSTITDVINILSMSDASGAEKYTALLDLFSVKMTALAGKAEEVLPDKITNAAEYVAEALTKIGETVPSFLSAGRTCMQSVRSGFQQAKQPLLDTTRAIAGDAVGAFVGFKGEMLSTGIEFIGEFANGVSEDLSKGENSQIRKNIQIAVDNISGALVKALPAVATGGLDLIKGLADGVAANSDQLTNAVSSAVQAVVTWCADKNNLEGLVTSGAKIAAALLEGLFRGLTRSTAKLLGLEDWYDSWEKEIASENADLKVKTITLDDLPELSIDAGAAAGDYPKNKMINGQFLRRIPTTGYYVPDASYDDTITQLIQKNMLTSADFVADEFADKLSIAQEAEAAMQSAQGLADIDYSGLIESTEAATTAMQEYDSAIVQAAKDIAAMNAAGGWDGASLPGTGAAVYGGAGGGFASGLPYVPMDDYIARLHRGEMVLTRQQADAYRAGVGGSSRIYNAPTTLNVGQMNLSGDLDARRVAQALSRETTRQMRALGRRG